MPILLSFHNHCVESWRPSDGCIYASGNLFITDLDNCLSPFWHQAIIWSNRLFYCHLGDPSEVTIKFIGKLAGTKAQLSVNRVQSFGNVLYIHATKSEEKFAIVTFFLYIYIKLTRISISWKLNISILKSLCQKDGDQPEVCILVIH